MRIISHQTLKELERLAARQTTLQLFRLLRGIVLAMRGESASKIAAALGCTQRSAQKWARSRMREIRPSGSMSREWKRSASHRVAP